MNIVLQTNCQDYHITANNLRMSFALLDKDNNIIPVDQSVIVKIPKLNEFFSEPSNKTKVFKLNFSLEEITYLISFMTNNVDNNATDNVTDNIANNIANKIYNKTKENDILFTFLGLEHIVNKYIEQEDDRYTKYFNSKGMALAIVKNLWSYGNDNTDGNIKYKKTYVNFEKPAVIIVTMPSGEIKHMSETEYANFDRQCAHDNAQMLKNKKNTNNASNINELMYDIDKLKLNTQFCPYEKLYTETFYIGNFVKTKDYFKINKQILEIIITIISKMIISQNQSCIILEKQINFENYEFKLVIYITSPCSYKHTNDFKVLSSIKGYQFDESEIE